MKIALMSGAVKNAGDFLIVDRARKILGDTYPQSMMVTYCRNFPLTSEQVKEINQMDFIVFAGGPFYKWNIYPQSLPLVENLDELKPPMFMLGGGWYGDTTKNKEVWSYKFSEQSKELLKRVQGDTDILGCRDYYAVKVLRENGIQSVLMTGCPAWYDIAKIGKRLDHSLHIDKIAVSDPADIFHFGGQSVEIVQYLRKKFPCSKIVYVFHRGTNADSYTSEKTAAKIGLLKEKLSEMQVRFYDIAYGCKGFKIYDDCDLHVGHRVHAHIYNLSQRKCSILVEEDSRGAGVNEALGLWGIKAYARKKGRNSSFSIKLYNKLFDYMQINKYCIKEIDCYLDYMLSTKADIMNFAYSGMEKYYNVMRLHVSSLEKFL